MQAKAPAGPAETQAEGQLCRTCPTASSVLHGDHITTRGIKRLNEYRAVEVGPQAATSEPRLPSTILQPNVSLGDGDVAAREDLQLRWVIVPLRRAADRSRRCGARGRLDGRGHRKPPGLDLTVLSYLTYNNPHEAAIFVVLSHNLATFKMEPYVSQQTSVMGGIVVAEKHFCS